MPESRAQCNAERLIGQVIQLQTAYVLRTRSSASHLRAAPNRTATVRVIVFERVASCGGKRANGMPRDFGCRLKHPLGKRASEHNVAPDSLNEIEEAWYGAL